MIEKYLKSMVLCFGLGAGLGAANGAGAADITFAAIQPHEYDLPVNFKDFYAFAQYGEFNSASQYFNASGNLAHIGRQNLGVGLSKFVWFTSLDALPGVGFAVQAILPEVYLGLRGSGEQVGFGDTIWGVSSWFKPSGNTTLGVQSLFSAPIGTDNFTSNYFANYSSILFDVQSDRLSFTGNVGGVFRSNQTTPGVPTISPGTTFHTNLRLGFKLGRSDIPVEPFLALDYQYNTAARYALSGAALPNSNNQDLALGAGVTYFHNATQTFSIRYSRSVYGVNTTPTNAVFLKFVQIIP